jgi:hypothetical protein
MSLQERIDAARAAPAKGSLQERINAAKGAEQAQPVDITPANVAHDVGTTLVGTGLDTLDMDRTVPGLASQGINKVMTSFPNFFKDRPGLTAAGGIAQDYLQRGSERTKPSELLNPEFKEVVTKRNIPKGQSKLMDRSMLGVELAAGGLKNPLNLRKWVDDIAAAGGGIAGAEIGDAIDTENSETVGTLLGAVLGGGLGSLPGRQDRGAVRSAYEFLDESTDDGVPNLLRNVASRDTSEIGSLADVVPGNRGLRRAQNFADRNHPPTGDALTDIEHLRDAQIVQQTAGVVSPAGATPAGARRQASVRAAGGEATAGRSEAGSISRALRGEREGISQATERAAPFTEIADAADIGAIRAGAKSREAVENLNRGIDATVGGVPSPATASKLAHGAIEEGVGEGKKAAGEIWKRVDAGEKIPTAEMKTALKGFLDGEFPPGTLSRAAFDKANKEYIDTIQGLDPAGVDPKDITWLISQTKSAIEEATPLGKTPTYMTNKLRELSAVVEKSVEEGSEAYRGARAASKEVFDRYEIRDLKADPETFLTPARISGQEGAVTANKLMAMKDKAARRAAEDYVLSLAKKTVAEGGDIRKFLDQNSELISRLPRLRTLSEGAKGLRSEVDTTEKGLARAVAGQKKARAKATAEENVKDKSVSKLTRAKDEAVAAAKDKRRAGKKRLSGTVTARYADEGKVDKLVKDWVTTPGTTSDFKRAVKSFDDRGQGTSFRADVRDKLINELAPYRYGERAPNSGSLGKWKKARGQLVDSGAIDEAGAVRIDKILQRTKTKPERSAVRSAERPEVSQTMGDLEASAAAALTSSALPIKGHRLLMGNAIKRAFVKYGVKPDPDPRVMAELQKVFTDPEALAKLASKYDNQKDMTDAVLRTILAVEAATKEE